MARADTAPAPQLPSVPEDSRLARREHWARAYEEAAIASLAPLRASRELRDRRWVDLADGYAAAAKYASYPKHVSLEHARQFVSDGG